MVSLSLNITVPPIQYWDIKKNNADINTFKCILTLKLIFFVTLFSYKVPWKRLEHSELEKNTRLRLLFTPTLLLCSNRLLRALQQNRTH